MARRTLVPGFVKLWDQEITVDWAEPEPDIDDEQMTKVKVLYVRNFDIGTTPGRIQKIFEDAINNKIERIKKIYDYAFIHFYQREHAELAMSKLQNYNIDGTNIEICWAKPVDRDLYRIQKLNRGNAKFNPNLNFAQTLMLYKQHVEKKEYVSGSPKDEGIGSAYAGCSPCTSPVEQIQPYSCTSNYPLAPARLEAMCKRYFWPLPIYTYQKHVDPTGVVLWVCTVDLPRVGQPLFTVPCHIGPLMGRPSCSIQQANIDAADIALHTLKMQRVELMQQSTTAPPVYSPIPQFQNCVNLPLDYPAIYPQSQPVLPLTIPTVWRTI